MQNLMFFRTLYKISEETSYIKLYKISEGCKLHIRLVGCFIWFNIRLDLYSVLMPTDRDSSLSMIRKHAIKILIHYEGDDFPALVLGREAVL